MNFSEFLVDYAQHPAYLKLESNTRYPEAQLSDLIDQVDQFYHELVASDYQPTRRLFVRYYARMSPLFRKIEQIVSQNAQLEKTKKHVSMALKNTFREIFMDIRWHQQTKLFENSNLDLSAGELKLLEDYQKQGVVEVNAGFEQLRSEIVKEAEKFKPAMRETAQKHPNGRVTQSIPKTERIWNLVEQLLNESGALKVVTHYMKSPVDFHYISFEYSHDRQTWWKNCYQQAQIPTSPLAYMHYDYATTIPKGMVYLSDVTPTSGAFRYVLGSHQFPRSTFLTFLYRDLDMEQHKLITFKNDQYYRTRYGTEEARKEILDLPKHFRSTSHFGDDFLDSNPLTAQIQKLEKTFVGKAGSLVLFDGCRGLHRGANVESGERWSLQLAMSVVPHLLAEEKFKFYVKDQMGRVGRLAKRIRKKLSTPTPGAST